MGGATRADAGHAARVFGSAGEQPRLRGWLRLVWPLLGAMAAAGFLLGAAGPWAPLAPGAVGIGLVAVALALAVAWRASASRLGAFIKGARGEEAVGRILALLPADFAVFHGVAGVSADDWDHVVVGPTGVFVVETKNWEGAIRCEGDRILVNDREPDRPPLAQVSAAANALRALLRTACAAPVPVQPVLCFTAAGMTAPASQGVAGVIVCADRQLPDAIRHRAGEPPLTPELRARIEDVLRERLA